MGEGKIMDYVTYQTIATISKEYQAVISNLVDSYSILRQERRLY